MAYPKLTPIKVLLEDFEKFDLEDARTLVLTEMPDDCASYAYTNGKGPWNDFLCWHETGNCTYFGHDGRPMHRHRTEIRDGWQHSLFVAACRISSEISGQTNWDIGSHRSGALIIRRRSIITLGDTDPNASDLPGQNLYIPFRPKIEHEALEDFALIEREFPGRFQFIPRE